MTQYPVKAARIKLRDDSVRHLILIRKDKGDYRWINAVGEEFDGVAYLDEVTAMKALRLAVEVDHARPEFIGADLTIDPVGPPPSRRAAEKMSAVFHRDWDNDPEKAVEEATELIEQETRVSELLNAYQELLAYSFTRRPAFAKALFPKTPEGEPRDLVFDGLLLACIEATEKATLQDFDNLKKILKQPVSRIIGATSMPQKGPVQ